MLGPDWSLDSAILNSSLLCLAILVVTLILLGNVLLSLEICAVVVMIEIDILGMMALWDVRNQIPPDSAKLIPG